jgi:hypothetical protein
MTQVVDSWRVLEFQGFTGKSSAKMTNHENSKELLGK